MKALYTVAQIRAIECAAAATLEPGTLMQRAGQAAANVALAMLAGRANRSVLLLAGPGNNGGDALEAAANLAHASAGVDVAVIHLPGSQGTSAETAQALARAAENQVRFLGSVPDMEPGLVIDGLFGIGLARPLDGAARALAEAVNALGWPVLALDVPSGLDADTGAVVGPHGVAIHAVRTLTFIGDKPGLYTFEGRDHAGEVQVDSLAIEAEHFPPAQAQLNGPALFANYLKPRANNSHKGSFGDVAIVGGAHGMAGAPMLSARGALFTGAGRVLVASLDPGPAVDSVQPEIMFRDAAAYPLDQGTLVVGPGMGGSAHAMELLAKALAGDAALVLDADALNLIAASVDLQQRLARRPAPTVLTPHPLEAARLLGVSAAEVQHDRLASARLLAARFNAVVVLKGSGSVIAAPHGAVVVNTSGNPGLASAGTGDVLAGICGGLLAQGWPAHEAAMGAAWIHGAAADRLVEQGVGPIGMCAGELPAQARAVLNELVANAAVRPNGRPQS
ncbi:MAG: bifunctional ADP-dependent NAD(P)H-hydrate dehydratase/NAD(P)H-hydrate epimerase [Massilia sp.]|nr:bifunctional ADP-dependent NAD(P)H-hydrate dehydratase/NAD(P)H-hydrate epimerase [Massilia sp.]